MVLAVVASQWQSGNTNYLTIETAYNKVFLVLDCFSKNTIDSVLLHLHFASLSLVAAAVFFALFWWPQGASLCCVVIQNCVFDPCLVCFVRFISVIFLFSSRAIFSFFFSIACSILVIVRTVKGNVYCSIRLLFCLTQEVLYSYLK